MGLPIGGGGSAGGEVEHLLDDALDIEGFVEGGQGLWFAMNQLVELAELGGEGRRTAGRLVGEGGCPRSVEFGGGELLPVGESP
ncbi:MAG: hypothetical protein AAF567_20965 [Actinomycetota bacterium]